MNDTPSAQRVHISFFGRRNAGKSSIINAVTGQDLAIVSEIAGTTTDPVSKSMELLPLGPVVMTDTPGIDDEGPLGQLRVKKSYQALNKTDLAILVVDAQQGTSSQDLKLIQKFEEKELPYLIVYNKVDLLEQVPENTQKELWVSAKKGLGIYQLKEAIAQLGKNRESSRKILGDLLQPSDLVILVVPIDSAAPKGRLILPQQQTIRDILDADAFALVVKENGLSQVLDDTCRSLPQEASSPVSPTNQMKRSPRPFHGKRPRMVITDSQVFHKVMDLVPREIPLTSFSILFARYKGNLNTLVAGSRAVDQLRDGDRVLISEGCTHHRQCEDIGTVKLPGWIRNHTKKQLTFHFTSGREFPEDLSPYRLVVHCGGCMLNEREMQYRIRCARDQQVPITNYGTLIAYMNGILERSLEVFTAPQEVL
jgi:small GTP-binding protein